jgi:hypothetical protein
LPAVHTGVDWTFDADGRLARALGIAIAADGRITLLGANPLSPSAPLAGWLAMPCLAPVALLCPAWAVAPMSRTARVASLVLTGGGVITLLHLVAGARITPAAGVLACFPLALALFVSRSGERVAGAGLH